MKTEQPVTVLPWHREAAKDIHDLELDAAVNGKFDRTQDEQIQDHAAIIARHDPHAATLRLLDELDSWVESTDGYEGESSCLRHQIRAHLAAHSKPSAHADGKKGTR